MNHLSKRLLLVLAIIVLIVAVLAYYFASKKPLGQDGGNQMSPVTVKEVSKTIAPAGLPENMPIEAGSKILQNYEATAKQGNIQGTRKLTTNKSIPEAVKVYTDFFSKLSWKVVEEKQDESYSTVLMKRNKSTLLIVVRKDSAAGTNVVEITLTEPERKN